MNPQQPTQPQQQPQQPNYSGLPPVNPSQSYQQPTATPQQYVQPQVRLQQQPYVQQSQYQPQPQIQQPRVDYMGGPTQADQQEYSIDYLNRIAPKEQKTINRFAVFGLIGGVLLAAIFAIILMANSRGPSPNEQLPIVSARITTLQTVVTEQQKHLAITQISESNAALGSTLSTMNTDITTILTDRKVKVSKTLTKQETTYQTTLSKTLNDAYQKGTLDRTYASQMKYELTLLRNEIVKLRKTSTATAIRTFCDDGLKNIDLIIATYDSFDASKS